MKLADLIKEQPSPDENNLIDILKDTLERWEKLEYRGGIEKCTRSDFYYEDIKEIIEDYEEENSMTGVAMDADSARDFSPMQEQKLRKLIRKTIRQ